MNQPDAARDVNRLLVIRSGLFDADFYLQAHPDVAAAGHDPVNHFIDHGGVEGRIAGGIFDGAAYLDEHKDVRAAGLNPLLHFIWHGIEEGRLITLGEARPHHWVGLTVLGSEAAAIEASEALRQLSRSTIVSRDGLVCRIDCFAGALADVELELYVTRSDFDRSISLNDGLVRELLALKRTASGRSLEAGLAAELETLRREVAVLRQDAREADLDVVYWRRRAEQAEADVRNERPGSASS